MLHTCGLGCLHATCETVGIIKAVEFTCIVGVMVLMS